MIDEKETAKIPEQEDVMTQENTDVVNGDITETDQNGEEELSIEEQLEIARDEAAKNLDGFLRAQAELSNARKRFEKQRSLTYINANADLIRKLLPVIDDFDRAIENVPGEIQEHSWFTGIELVQKKLLGILDSFDVMEIEAVGLPFDPFFHEALGQEPSDEYESGMVSRVMQKGYQIGEKVVRPALVYVAG